jgi:dephospho-CoA kinase
MKHTLTVNREITVNKLIIGGKLRSGKDTVADHLWLRITFSALPSRRMSKKSRTYCFPTYRANLSPESLIKMLAKR